MPQLQATPEALRLIYRLATTETHEVPTDVFRRFVTVDTLNQLPLDVQSYVEYIARYARESEAELMLAANCSDRDNDPICGDVAKCCTTLGFSHFPMIYQANGQRYDLISLLKIHAVRSQQHENATGPAAAPNPDFVGKTTWAATVTLETIQFDRIEVDEETRVRMNKAKSKQAAAERRSITELQATTASHSTTLTMFEAVRKKADFTFMKATTDLITCGITPFMSPGPMRVLQPFESVIDVALTSDLGKNLLGSVFGSGAQAEADRRRAVIVQRLS